MREREQSIWVVGAALTVLGIFSLGCGNECGFFERCNGNTYEICGEGVDQQFNRDIREFPCEGENSVCVELSDQSAACVSPELCDATFVPTCSDNVLTTCVMADKATQGHKQITNCRANSPDYSCGLSGANVPYCQYTPPASMQ